MKWWLYLTTLWIPIGRLYCLIWMLVVVKQVTWKELITDRQYRIMIIESGIFGLATGFFNARHFKHLKRKQHDKSSSSN